MKAELRSAIAELLAIEPDTVEPFGMAIPADRHLAFARLAKDHGYVLYVTVVASHHPAEAATKTAPERAERFEVATILRRPDKQAAETLAWRVELKPQEPVASLVGLFAGADWQEREQYDLVGVRFAGHPDLRRLMMDEDWPGHPLRKDYAIDTAHRPWR